MGKMIRMWGIAALVLGVVSCGKKADGEVTGTLVDGTMNAMVIETLDGDTLTFSTIAAEKIVPDEGILEGDTVIIVYDQELMADETPAAITPAKKVTVKHLNRASDKLTGKWVQPIPGMEGQKQGVDLKPGGMAESVNMATLQYKEWASYGDSPTEDAGKLVLKGTSIGNGVTTQFCDTFNVVKLTADSLVLSGPYSLSYSREIME